MSFLTLWLSSGLVILVLMSLLWLLSLSLKDSSIVDIFWGAGFVITFWISTILVQGNPPVRILLLGLILTLWGLRLSLHILTRNAGKPEDFRYAAWREEAGVSWWWRSFFKVFVLQGAIMWVVSIPLLAAQIGDASSPFKCLDNVGLALWMVGFLFETGGDLQLARFKANPKNKGKLFNSGLWSLTRHPNYFGDAAQWWAFYLIAASTGAIWTIISPILMTYLLIYVSGVAMLEGSLAKNKPGYEDYISHTSSFFPWIPRAEKKHHKSNSV
jgi:steroid 5-alpha reductase family enzyme